MRANKLNLFPIGLGLICGLRFLISFDVVPLIFKSIIFIILLVVFYRKKSTLFFLIPFLVGVGVSFIDNLISYQDGVTTLTGIVVSSKTNYIILQNGIRKFYVYAKDNTYQVGDILKVYGKISDYTSTTYESKFDFGNYLKLKGVYKTLKVYDFSFVFKIPFRIKEHENDLISKLDYETGSILDSLLFNRKNYSSASITNATSIGLINILSTSGIVYGALLRFVEFCLSIKLKDSKSFQISTILGFLFLPICLEKIGILKIMILRLFRIFNQKRNTFTYLDLLSITAFILIIFDYHNVYQTGFMLSFGVSFILYFSSYLVKRSNQFIRKYMRYFLIQLFILPVAISTSKGIHLLTPFYSVLVLPLIEIFSFIGILSFIFAPIPVLVNSLGWIIGKILLLFSRSDLFVSLPFGQTFTYTYYFVFFTCLLIHEIGDIKIRDLIVLIYTCVCLISCIPVIPFFTSEITFINVGQGDCCLIRERDKAVMIDTGGSTSFDMAKEVLIPYLHSRRIYKLDCLIGTHGDYDHIGAKDSLMNSFPCKKYVSSAENFPIKIGNINLFNYNTYGLVEENESSLVIWCKVAGYSCLITGDAPIAVEEMILKDNPDLDCDILKVGHHGSSTSSSLKFLKAISPIEAVISVGATNSYGHPSEEVISRLENLNIKIRRTDIEGTISYIKGSVPFL